MKIHLLSDIHLEFGKFKHTPPECDLAILAGDIHPGVKGLVWANETFGDIDVYENDPDSYIPVVAIAGNHEYYNGNRQLPRFNDTLAQKADDLYINFLQNQAIVIDGVRFVGCTLWTDFSLVGNQPLMMMQAEMIVTPYPKETRRMNDYNYVKQEGGGRLRTDTVLAEHIKSRQFLEETLSEDFDGPTVVITHHAPSEMSCNNHFKADPENAFYATNLHRMIEVMQPTVWVHGHMHSSSDYMIGDTRIITNPRGYVGQSGYNQDFDPNFVFEV